MNTKLYATTGRDATGMRKAGGVNATPFGMVLTLLLAGMLVAQPAAAQQPVTVALADGQRVERTTEATAASIVTVANPDVAPVPLNLDAVKQRIGYPTTALAESADGPVIVRLLVDSRGKAVRTVLTHPGSHPALTQAVLQHVAALEFSPARANGQAVASWVTLPIQFVLE